MPNLAFNQKSKAVFFTILAGVLWGTSFPIIKLGLSTIDPFAFVFWRFLFASVTLLVIMQLLGKLKFKITHKKLLVFLGIANGSGYLLQYVGMNYTTTAKAALFINLSAMWVALLSPRLLGENFSHKKIAGVLFGLTGIIFVSTNLDFSGLSGGQLTGDAMLLVSGVAWALFMIYNKKLITGSTSEVFQSMTGVLVLTMLSIAPFTVFAGTRLFDLSGMAWAAIAYTAIVCWVIPYYLWLEGLKHLSAFTSSVLLLSEIVVAVVASVAVLKEPITVFSTIGAFFIIIAIALVSVRDKQMTQKT
ncbi:EamA family transporter [Candidatus Bathyarchaeota archaeon]|nr:EamA family transporter [Candidatus Bathyarchaeota archaeon]